MGARGRGMRLVGMGSRDYQVGTSRIVGSWGEAVRGVFSRLRRCMGEFKLVLVVLGIAIILTSGAMYGCGGDEPQVTGEEEEPALSDLPEPTDDDPDDDEVGIDDETGDGEPGTIGPEESGEETSVDPSEDEEMWVHFIDVGQGDAILVESGNVKILIDGGPRSAGQVVVDYLVRRGIRELDLVIGTHPHADHIGGLIEVFRQLTVNRIIDAGVPHTTVTFDDYLTEIEKQVEAGHCMYEIPESQVLHNGALVLTVLGPERDLGSLNDNSVVCRVDFGETSFLFTGDAERAAERDLLGRGGVDLEADVLKVGHHGSRSSTTGEFLAAVSPTHAVIMAGAGNRYGHPHEEVVARLDAAGVKLYRTDIHGTVVFVSDGQTIVVTESPWSYAPQSDEPDQPSSSHDDPGDATGGININTASLEELQKIVHIGPSRAEDIVRLRPFKSIDDLTRVSGIGPSRLQDIREEGLAYVD